MASTVINETTLAQINSWKASMQEFKARHAACVKQLTWRNRVAQTVTKALGVLAGSAGAAPLVMSFVNDQQQFTFGFTEGVALFGGVCAVAQTWMAVQDFGRRADQHANTAGNCAAFLNKIDGMLMDAQQDQHDMTEDLAALEHLKTQIEKEAPPL